MASFEYLYHEWECSDDGGYPVFYFTRLSDGVTVRKAVFSMRVLWKNDGLKLWDNYTGIPQNLRQHITQEGEVNDPLPLPTPKPTTTTGVGIGALGLLFFASEVL